MATLRSKNNLAAVSGDNQEKDLMNKLSRNANAPRLNEDYIIQVSAETAKRKTEMLSQEISRTKN